MLPGYQSCLLIRLSQFVFWTSIQRSRYLSAIPTASTATPASLTSSPQTEAPRPRPSSSLRPIRARSPRPCLWFRPIRAELPPTPRCLIGGARSTHGRRWWGGSGGGNGADCEVGGAVPGRLPVSPPRKCALPRKCGSLRLGGGTCHGSGGERGRLCPQPVGSGFRGQRREDPPKWAGRRRRVWVGRALVSAFLLKLTVFQVLASPRAKELDTGSVQSSKFGKGPWIIVCNELCALWDVSSVEKFYPMTTVLIQPESCLSFPLYAAVMAVQITTMSPIRSCTLFKCWQSFWSLQLLRILSVTWECKC